MIKRTYKDSLFTFIFGREERKADLLSLYNALNNRNYTDTDNLTINTIEDVIYLGYKNDVSCIVTSDNVMSLYEQQSTVNPNLPIRGLIYFSRLYEKYISQNNINIYSSSLKKLPIPEFYVFYVGKSPQPEKQILRLSDMFDKSDFSHNIALECVATVLNITQGFNEQLLKDCDALWDYAYFVDSVYRCQKYYDTIEVAIDKAVEKCIEAGVLRSILVSHKAEVKNMLLTEFNEEEYIELVKKEEFENGKNEGIELGKSEGIEIGKSEGKMQFALQLIEQGKLTREEAAAFLGISIEELPQNN